MLEHLTPIDGVALLREYLGYVRPAGTVVLITPQERGYRSDSTHVAFLDFTAQEEIAAAADLDVVRQDSFPFPRWAGGVFPYNEFVTVARRAQAVQ